MLHPSTELVFISEEVGYGVVATSFIPRGTLTWVLDALDQRIPAHRTRELGPPYDELLQRYAYTDSHGWSVLAWDHGRYINHSCEPNSVGAGADEFEIAIRDIHPGEQLSDDYSEFSDFEPFTCRCGTPSCRGDVTASTPAQRRLRRQQVEDALRVSNEVPQALGELARQHEVLTRWLERPIRSA